MDNFTVSNCLNFGSFLIEYFWLGYFPQSSACLSCALIPGICEAPTVVWLRVVACLQSVVACPVVVAVVAVGVGVGRWCVAGVVGVPPLCPLPPDVVWHLWLLVVRSSVPLVWRLWLLGVRHLALLE